jgi:hypothetical protein
MEADASCLLVIGLGDTADRRQPAVHAGAVPLREPDERPMTTASPIASPEC